MNAMADPAPEPGTAQALEQLRQEIEEVEKEITANERWEGGRPCGAEAQRARLASLSECLAALTGGAGAAGQKVGQAAAAFVAAAAGGKFEGGGIAFARQSPASGVENLFP
jgi:hypothetical protein